MGPTQADTQAWAGFCESRFRKLVSDLLGRSLPVKKIQLWPKKISACIADQGALLTQAQRQNCLTYFIGFQLDRKRMRGDQLNVELPLHNFRDWDLGRFQPLVPGMDILVKDFKVKELPKICFDEETGGKEAVMKKRRMLMDSDPARLERKRLEKLEALKAKMADIQKKKDDKKRKREEVDLAEEEEETATAGAETTDVPAKTKEEEGDDGDDEINEETDLLASALDTIQETTDRKQTREEAEAEKEKLLAGDLEEEEAADGEGYESDENEVGYSKDDARQVFVQKKKEDEKGHDKRSLPVSEEIVEALRAIGYSMVSDDEATQVGANMIPLFRRGRDPKEFTQVTKRGKITFLERFDMVELDALGHVIDKGDEDFEPSRSWVGRKAGFEFKVGERGLGYYRTGKTVVVPSNTAY